MKKNFLQVPVFALLAILFFGAVSHGQRESTFFAKPSPTIIKSFKAASLAPDFDTTHVSQYIRSIFQDTKGHLWFGTIAEGVVRYDEKTLTYFSNPDGFVNQTVYAINEDKQGNMWFGTDQGVYKYNGKKFRNFNQKDGLNHLDISRKSILVDKSGTIWVGTHGGVYQYNSSADSTGRQSFSMFSPFPKMNVTGIMEDKNGKIWIATSDKGVFCYDGKTLTNTDEKERLGDNYAGGLAQDRAGNMWFVMKNGICKYDGKIFTEYTAKDGLGGTEFWGIIIEESGIIWVTARGATTRFDPSIALPNPKAFRVFTPADGLNCCVQSMFQDKSGKMWWGTGQGLYRFDDQRFYQVKKNGPWE
jgi:ligand-binding sensor domain-containing protein